MSRFVSNFSRFIVTTRLLLDTLSGKWEMRYVNINR
jgi:hypothetical protein